MRGPAIPRSWKRSRSALRQRTISSRLEFQYRLLRRSRYRPGRRLHRRYRLVLRLARLRQEAHPRRAARSADLRCSAGPLGKVIALANSSGDALAIRRVVGRGTNALQNGGGSADLCPISPILGRAWKAVLPRL